MATSNILAFADSAAVGDIDDDATYAADAVRTNGNVAGIAQRKPNNKALKQATKIAAGLAKFIADNQGTNITDALTIAQVASFFTTALAAVGVTAASIQNQTVTSFTTAGTSTAYTATPSPALGSPTAKQRLNLNFHTPPGSNPTLSVSGGTAKAIKYYDIFGAKQNISAVQVISGNYYDVEYDGTDYIVLSPTSNFDFSRSLIGNGYAKLPGGIIIQWGTNGNTGNPTAFTFPVSYPNATFAVVPNCNNPNNPRFVTVGSVTQGGFSASGWVSTSGVAANESFQWIAVGY